MGTEAEVARLLLCADTYAQWSFAGPGAGIGTARLGVSHALSGFARRNLTAELAAAELAAANDPSEENDNRLIRLRETQLELLAGDDAIPAEDSVRKRDLCSGAVSPTNERPLVRQQQRQTSTGAAMATKTANATENGSAAVDNADAPLIDAIGGPVKKLIARGKERGFVTYDELNAALPPDQVSSEQIEDTMAHLSELGINVVEGEEADDVSPEDGKAANGAAPSGSTDDDEDLGRTDDPVRMYLREMGSVELLSREGEIAIAKRIEAGRERMIRRDQREHR